MRKLTRSLTLLLILSLGVLASTGCRTAEGAGEDIENLGEGIQDTID